MGWHSRLPCRLPLSSAFSSSQPASTVPLVPETWLCHTAPVPDHPPSKDPCQTVAAHPPNPGRDQTPWGSEAGQDERSPPLGRALGVIPVVWSQESLTPALSVPRGGGLAWPSPQHPLTQHTRQQFFLETIILLSQRNFITYLQSSFFPKIQSNKLTFSI